MKRLIVITLSLLAILIAGQSYSAEITVNPKFSALDDSGNPLVGGCLYSYDCGTTDKAATCANDTCSSDNTNPITLDSRGEADVYIDQCFKFALYEADTDGVCDSTPRTTLIWTKDNLQPFSSVFASVADITAGVYLLDEDDMASNSNTQGVTQQSIVTYMRNFNSVSEMRSMSGPVAANQFSRLTKYSVDGDGGGNFYWDSTSTETDNDDTIIKVASITTGRWKKLKKRYSYKTPRLDWDNLDILWVGTSIPHQGAGDDGYPELFSEMVGSAAVNEAWSGSHITWDDNAADESCATGINSTKGLAATVRELTAKQTAALPDDGADAYDASCSVVNNPLVQGYETRINDRYAIKPFDVVFVDHGHNDRDAELGTLTPTPITVVAITKGVTTTIKLSPSHGLSQYDDITVRTSDIADMDYWTGEISSVSGDDIVIGLDSSGFTGSYSSGGTVVSYDKSKVYDAYNLIINDIYHMNVTYGSGVDIILMTPPSVWSGGVDDGRIESINRAVRNVAEKWELSLYDLTDDMDIGEQDNLTFLGDGIHPITTSQRKSIASHIYSWATGEGLSPLSTSDKNYVINGSSAVKQQTANPTLSGTFQYGVDMSLVKYNGTVTAGTIGQDVNASFGTSGFASKVTGFTSTVGGNLAWDWRIPSKISKALINKKATLSCKIKHDAGVDIASTIALFGADVADDFSAVTVIGISAAKNVASGTETTLLLTIDDVGDTSKGLSIRITSACGIFTTKNFYVTDVQIVEGLRILPFKVDYNEDLSLSELFYRPLVRGGWSGEATGTTVFRETVNFRDMYSLPVANLTPVTNTNLGAITANQVSENHVELQATAVGAGATTARVFIELDARL